MSGPGADRSGPGALTGASGTPKAVDVSGDRGARRIWLVLLGGPLVWLAHFAVTYLVAEAGCTGSGPGLEAFDPPAPRIVTVAATAIALALCALVAVRAASVRRRAGRGETRPIGTLAEDPARLLATVGMLLAGISATAVLFAGLLTPLLPGCTA